MLDLGVDRDSERGLLGIAVHPAFPPPRKGFFGSPEYWALSSRTLAGHVRVLSRLLGAAGDRQSPRGPTWPRRSHVLEVVVASDEFQVALRPVSAGPGGAMISTASSSWSSP